MEDKLLVLVAESVDFKKFGLRLSCPLSEDSYHLVQTFKQYEALEDPYQYKCILVIYGSPAITHVLNDQAIQSTNLKWVHCMSAGIDGCIAAKDFVNSSVILTNGKGAFSGVLGEFVVLGMLFFAKKIPSFR